MSYNKSNRKTEKSIPSEQFLNRKKEKSPTKITSSTSKKEEKNQKVTSNKILQSSKIKDESTHNRKIHPIQINFSNSNKKDTFKLSSSLIDMVDRKSFSISMNNQPQEKQIQLLNNLSLNTSQPFKTEDEFKAYLSQLSNFATDSKLNVSTKTDIEEKEIFNKDIFLSEVENYFKKEEEDQIALLFWRNNPNNSIFDIIKMKYSKLFSLNSSFGFNINKVNVNSLLCFLDRTTPLMTVLNYIKKLPYNDTRRGFCSIIAAAGMGKTRFLQELNYLIFNNQETIIKNCSSNKNKYDFIYPIFVSFNGYSPYDESADIDFPKSIACRIAFSIFISKEFHSNKNFVNFQIYFNRIWPCFVNLQIFLELTNNFLNERLNKSNTLIFLQVDEIAKTGDKKIVENNLTKLTNLLIVNNDKNTLQLALIVSSLHQNIFEAQIQTNSGRPIRNVELYPLNVHYSNNVDALLNEFALTKSDNKDYIKKLILYTNGHPRLIEKINTLLDTEYYNFKYILEDYIKSISLDKIKDYEQFKELLKYEVFNNSIEFNKTTDDSISLLYAKYIILGPISIKDAIGGLWEIKDFQLSLLHLSMFADSNISTNDGIMQAFKLLNDLIKNNTISSHSFEKYVAYWLFLNLKIRMENKLTEINLIGPKDSDSIFKLDCLNLIATNITLHSNDTKIELIDESQETLNNIYLTKGCLLIPKEHNPAFDIAILFEEVAILIDCKYSAKNLPIKTNEIKSTKMEILKPYIKSKDKNTVQFKNKNKTLEYDIKNVHMIYVTNKQINNIYPNTKERTVISLDNLFLSMKSFANFSWYFSTFKNE